MTSVARKSKQSRSSSSSSTSSAASMASNSESDVSDDKSSSKSSVGTRPKKANRLKLKARKIVKSVKNKSKGIMNRSSTLSSASSSATSSSSTSTTSTASSASSSSPSSLSNSSSNSSNRKSKFAPKTSKAIIKTSDSRRADQSRVNSSKIVAVASTTSSAFPKSRISRIEDYHSNSRKRRSNEAFSNERRMDFRSRSPPIQRLENRSAIGSSRSERQWNRSPIKNHRVPDDDHFNRRSLSKSDRRSGGSNYVPRSKSRTSKDDEEWQRKLSVIERNLAINRMQEKLRNDTNLTREEREMLLEKERRAALARAQQRQKERERLAKFQQLSEKNIQFNRMLRKGEFKRRSLDRNDVPKSRGEQSRSISNETHQRTVDRDRTKTYSDVDRKRDRSVREREDGGIKDASRDRDYAKDRSRENDQVANQFKRECSDERRTSKFSRRNWSDRNYSEEEEDEDDDDDDAVVDTYSRSATVASRAQSGGERQEEGRCDNDQSATAGGGSGGDGFEAETVETDHESDSSRRSVACKNRTSSQISIFPNEKKRSGDGSSASISDSCAAAKNRIDFANVTQSSVLSVDNDDDFDEKSDEWSETDNLRIEEEWDKFEQLDSNKNGSDEIFRTDSSFEANKEQNNSDRNQSENFQLDESSTRNDDDNLSEISDEIDEILNRDEQHHYQQQQQQRPQYTSEDKNSQNRNKKTSVQSSKVEDGEISIDFEHISDSEFGEDRKTATDLSTDWSSLSKNAANNETTTKNEKLPSLLSSSVKQKWTFDEIIKKTGVSSRLLNVKNKEMADCGVDSKLQRQLAEQNGSLAATQALKYFKQELRSRLLYDSKTAIPQLAISAKRDLSMRRFLFDSSVMAFDRQQCILIDTDKFHNLAVHNFQKHIDPKPLL